MMYGVEENCRMSGLRRRVIVPPTYLVLYDTALMLSATRLSRGRYPDLGADVSFVSATEACQSQRSKTLDPDQLRLQHS